MRLKDLFWLSKGLYYSLRYPQISGGRLLKVKGKIYIEGDGKVDFGDNVVLDGRFGRPVVFRTEGGGKIELEDSVFINCGTYLSSGSNVIRIGEDSGIGPFNIILASNHDKISNSDIKKGVTLGENVLLYSNSKVLPGTKVGDDCVIGAGSVLPSLDVSEKKLIAGNPGKEIKEIEVLDR
ncbi:MAG: DapH/DapD/GlmU-related protein [Candidatus Nanohaloarchaea archaeon]